MNQKLTKCFSGPPTEVVGRGNNIGLQLKSSQNLAPKQLKTAVSGCWTFSVLISSDIYMTCFFLLLKYLKSQY